MRSFDYIESGKTLLTPHTTSLLAAIHEAKGRQSIQTTIRPDILGTLVAVARIQSTDASNRIEGISTSDSRLNDLVSEKVTPRNRNEEEIAGYRDALSVIHESHDYIPITPNVILQLHRDLFRHTPLTFAGHFKDSDNVIIERDAHGTSTARFAPPSALVTPELIERACSAYTQAIRDGHTDPLLAIAMFILDFTCIHPFNDGNGRMSRLLTLLMLCRNGYMANTSVSNTLSSKVKPLIMRRWPQAPKAGTTTPMIMRHSRTTCLASYCPRARNSTNASISRQAAERREHRE